MLIGIGGGTGSGKTFLALKLQEEFGERKVIIIEQDAYYKDLSHLTLNQRLEKKLSALKALQERQFEQLELKLEQSKQDAGIKNSKRKNSYRSWTEER